MNSLRPAANTIRRARLDQIGHPLQIDLGVLPRLEVVDREWLFDRVGHQPGGYGLTAALSADLRVFMTR